MKPPTERPGSRRTAVWISAALAALVVLLYGRTVRHEFVNLDDEAYIVDNPNVQGGLTGHGVVWAFTTTYEGNYHPVTWISHMLDVTLFGMRPGGHHAVSVILHAASAVLLFLAFRTMTRETWPSAFVAALFAAHPLRVESVAWAAERKDVLSGLLFMLVLVAYARYAGRPRPAALTGIAALLAAGLLAKPMLVTVPFVLLLLDRWPLARLAHTSDLKERIREKRPLFALSLAASALAVAAQRSVGVVGPMDAFPLSSRLANAATSYVAYLRKTVLPWDLAVFYPIPAQGASWARPALFALVLVAASVAAIRLVRTMPHLAVGWFWYLGMMVPVIGLVQVGTQAMADRYAYLPLIGIYVVLAWGLRDLVARLPRARLPVALAGAAVIASCAAATWIQVGAWRDSRALFEHALRVVPDDYVTHNGLGIVRATEGDLDGAAAEFARALQVKPDYAFAHYNLGLVHLRRGEVAPGEARFREAIRWNPAYAEAHYALGLVLEGRGARAEAAAHFQEALRFFPDLPGAREALGRVRRP